MDTGVRKIPVHPVNLRKVAAAAFWTGVHLQFLMAAVITVSKGKVHALIQGMMGFVDILVDGRFNKELKDNKLMWKGSSNQRVIDVQKSLESGSVVTHCADYASAAPDRSMYRKPDGAGRRRKK